jgi:hypothetical protein
VTWHRWLHVRGFCCANGIQVDAMPVRRIHGQELEPASDGPEEPTGQESFEHDGDTERDVRVLCPRLKTVKTRGECRRFRSRHDDAKRGACDRSDDGDRFECTGCIPQWASEGRDLACEISARVLHSVATVRWFF